MNKDQMKPEAILNFRTASARGVCRLLTAGYTANVRNRGQSVSGGEDASKRNSAASA
jgi:hypothetical protein